MSQTTGESPRAVCGHCAHFQNDPAALEKIYPGLTSMSSGYASVRAQDGICDRHGIYLSAHDSCPSFLARAGVPAVPARTLS